MMEKAEIKLVETARQGDPDSFRVLCEKYYTSMRAIAYSWLADDHLAEDAAQETFARACCELPRLKRMDKFGSWLAGICRNITKDMRQDQKRQFQAPDLSQVEDKPPNPGINDSVCQAINKLSDSAREIVVLRYYNNLSYEQITSVLGISRGAINGRLSRAKRKIAQHLEHNGFPREQL